jgi:hypothetical protein
VIPRVIFVGEQSVGRKKDSLSFLQGVRGHDLVETGDLLEIQTVNIADVPQGFTRAYHVKGPLFLRGLFRDFCGNLNYRFRLIVQLIAFLYNTLCGRARGAHGQENSC